MGWGGILGAMIGGAGNGIAKNAQDRIDEKRKKAKEDRDQKRKDDDDAKAEARYQQHLAQNQEIEGRLHDRTRAEKLADDNLKYQREVELAKLRSHGSGSRSNNLLARKISTFEKLGANIDKQIGQIFNGDKTKDLNLVDKVKLAAPYYAQLDNLVQNNKDMAEHSPAYSYFENEVNGFMTQFGKKTKKSGNEGDDLVLPDKAGRNGGGDVVIPDALKRRSSNNSPAPLGVLSWMTPPKTQSEPSKDLDWRERFGLLGKALGVERPDHAQGEQTADMDELNRQGGVRPF